MARQPIPRTNGGKYAETIEGKSELAIKVVNEICALNPDYQVIDIEHLFMKELGYRFAQKIAQESIGLDE